jgi:hypothetical protein
MPDRSIVQRGHLLGLRRWELSRWMLLGTELSAALGDGMRDGWVRVRSL